MVRSLALAHMLQEEFTLVFAIQQPEPALQAQIQTVCPTLIALPAEKDYPKEASFLAEQVLSPNDVVVLDGYMFKTEYQETLKMRGCTILCIDDIHSFPFVADAVLNQAGGITAAAYLVAPYTRLLLGPGYALLRRPFLEATLSARTLPAGSLKVMLNFGGADPLNITLQEARRLHAMAELSAIEIVTGSAYRYQQALENWAADKPRIKLHRNLPANDMCELMRACAVAVTSASGIAYEYAAVGGLLFIKQTADNQRGLYQFLLSTGIAADLAALDPNFLNDSLISDFGANVALQRQYFDGKSAERLRKVMAMLSLSASLTLRDVTEEDMLLLFNWSNEVEVRRRSFNSKPIPLDGHKVWFKQKLLQKDAYLYIAVVNGDAAAHIRFEVTDNSASISYMIGEEYRGKGLGHTVLLKGIRRLTEQRPGLTQVEGLVQQDNPASIRAFEKAGFIVTEPDKKYPQAHRFVLELKNAPAF